MTGVGAGFLFAPGSWQFVAGLATGVVALTLAAIAAITAHVLRRVAREADARLCEFEAGRYLARFTAYEQYELAAFAERELARLRRQTAWALPTTLGLIAGALGFGLALDPAGVARATAIAAASLLAGAMLGWLVRARVLSRHGRRLRRLVDDGAELIVGADAVWFAGQIPFLRAAFTRIEGARVVDGEPALLELSLIQWGGTSSARRKAYVPVPARDVDAARAVAAGLA